MSSISKPDPCADRACLALLSAYQEYLMTFKLMTSQVVQRARPLITDICVVGIQRVNEESKRTEFDGAFCKKFKLLIDRFSLFFPLNVKNR